MVLDAVFIIYCDGETNCIVKFQTIVKLLYCISYIELAIVILLLSFSLFLSSYFSFSIEKFSKKKTNYST